MRSMSVSDVVVNDLCSGCGGCALAFPDKIELRRQDGFLRPVELACLAESELHTFNRLCPGVQQKMTGSPRDLWGPREVAVLAASGDADERHAGSSGGVLTGLGRWLVETGAVDALVHVGADAESPELSTGRVSAASREALAGAGSRYAPATPLQVLGQALTTHKTVAVVAKPCEISALRSLMDERPELKERVPVLLSFFCAGVPSQDATSVMVQSLAGADSDPVSVRYRGAGWPGRAEVVVRDGSSYSMSYEESWGQILNQQLQTRCKLCGDGLGEAADVVACDFWETDERGYPKFENEEGRSLTLGRTPLGRELLDGAIDAGAIVAGESGEQLVEKLNLVQPYQVERRVFLAARLAGRRVTGLPIPHYPGYPMFAWTRLRLRGQLRQFAGGIRRALATRKARAALTGATEA